MIVVDASVIVDALVNGETGRAARARLSGTELSAPDILDVEVASALRGLWLTGRLDDLRLDRAVDDLSRLRVERYQSAMLVRRSLQHRANLTTYDATYVALAEALSCPLVTRDRRIATAPRLRCSVEVLR